MRRELGATTEIDATDGVATVTSVLSAAVPEVTLTYVVPLATARTVPPSRVATLELLVDQVAEEQSARPPFVSSRSADKNVDSPTRSVTLETDITTRAAGTVGPVQ